MSKKPKQPNKKKSNFKGSLNALIVKLFEKNADSELTHKQVCTILDLRENALRELAYNLLQELTESKILTMISHNTFIYNSNAEIYEGIMDLTARGSGYVIVDELEKDIFVPEQFTGQAMNGDRVKVKLTPTKRRLEGKVLEVVNRQRSVFVGTLQLHEKFAFLVPDNARVGTDIYIPKEKLNGAINGERVMVKINVWPKTASNPYGEVIERLGQKTANDAEMISILCNHSIPMEFPSDVINEAEKVTMDLDNDEIKKRLDLRNINTFTIDPVDAKDFDDALSFEFLENGNYKIGVHIADVSHYVQTGTEMDKEAEKRGNSTYLVDRVVPMLPEQLSNFACSLRPNEDKYSFSVIWEMTPKGKILDTWIGKTVIHSNRRFTYEEALEILDGAEGDFKKELHILNNIAKYYRKERMKAGALDIESEEIRFQLDDQKEPIGIIVKTSKDSHKLIEEFMLLANRHVAEYIGNLSKAERPPFVFRIHDKPDTSKIELFKLFIDKFGHELKEHKSESVAASINTLLNEIKGENEYPIIQSMAIRSMAKASYDIINIGHYGLAFEDYAHFTSPIRRYADLLVHRILFATLNKQSINTANLQETCKHISRTEKRSSEAERESSKYFQTIYVADKIGVEFEGTISGIAEHGLWVRMDENACEGMVPMAEIPGDHFYFDQENYRIVGNKTKKEYNFGDRVKVKIKDVHPRKRQIDLELV